MEKVYHYNSLKDLLNDIILGGSWDTRKNSEGKKGDKHIGLYEQNMTV